MGRKVTGPKVGNEMNGHRFIQNPSDFLLNRNSSARFNKKPYENFLMLCETEKTVLRKKGSAVGYSTELSRSSVDFLILL